MQIFVRLSVSQMKVCLELSVLCFCCFMSQINEKVNEIFSPSLNPIMSIDEGWIILQTQIALQFPPISSLSLDFTPQLLRHSVIFAGKSRCWSCRRRRTLQSRYKPGSRLPWTHSHHYSLPHRFIIRVQPLSKSISISEEWTSVEKTLYSFLLPLLFDNPRQNVLH